MIFKIRNKMINPLVSISCITYNHSNFIRECMDGFLMQKTNFPFEILIHDDCSTDGTKEIIENYAEKYPDIIKPLYEEENQYQNGKPAGSIVWNFPRAKGKYIAICEGDDYWTDPLKLQKQVDFLEAHQEYGMCYTNFNIYYQCEGKQEYNLFDTNPKKYPNKYYSPEAWVLRNGYVAPPTWLIRKEIIPQKIIDSNDNTFVLFTHFLVNSQVKYLNDTTATYRILQESAAHSKNYEKIYQRNKELLEVKHRLIDYYKLDKSYKELCEIKYYRQGLAHFVMYRKYQEIENARIILKNKNVKEQILLLIDRLNLNKALLKFYNIIKG